MTHDPLAALENEDLPTPTPWESIAQQARWLAEAADRCASMAAADLAPTEDADPLADLDARARALVGAAAACRRYTWQQLVDSGQSYAAVGRLWGNALSTVRNALVAQDRAR
ncbi:hypothetical protein [Nocardia sp. NBC_00511]|uniref:hypothetical protein n=1 Tax=Nocardia sp. NBC_00511 TaxID=2903591 RepID=UPI0030E183AD